MTYAHNRTIIEIDYQLDKIILGGLKMPARDGTGSAGRGQGLGRGGGIGAGPAGYCVCPKCGERVKHVVASPCTSIKCPKCGSNMVRG